MEIPLTGLKIPLRGSKPSEDPALRGKKVKVFLPSPEGDNKIMNIKKGL